MDINSVVINWIDQGLRSPGPDTYYRTTLNKTAGTISIKHMKDGRSMYWETVLPVDTGKMKKFFDIVSETNWEEDYSVVVCDGYVWGMTLKSGTKVVGKIIGTVDAPNVTKVLTELIYSMIEDQFCTDFPQLWGYVPEIDDLEEKG